MLNRRDFKVLRRAGIPEARLHYLPNPVEEPPRLPDQAIARRKLDPALSPARRVVLYPVRGIRRKNIGELLLWAAVFGDTTSFVLSLAPANPDERPMYEQFVRLARELSLPVYFDTGAAGGLSLERERGGLRCDVDDQRRGRVWHGFSGILARGTPPVGP